MLSIFFCCSFSSRIHCSHSMNQSDVNNSKEHITLLLTCVLCATKLNEFSSVTYTFRLVLSTHFTNFPDNSVDNGVFIAHNFTSKKIFSFHQNGKNNRFPITEFLRNFIFFSFSFYWKLHMWAKYFDIDSDCQLKLHR